MVSPRSIKSMSQDKGAESTHNNTVFPRENGKLIEASDKIPTSGDIASYKDAERKDREGVHRSAIPQGNACRSRSRLERRTARMIETTLHHQRCREVG